MKKRNFLHLTFYFIILALSSIIPFSPCFADSNNDAKDKTLSSKINEITKEKLYSLFKIKEETVSAVTWEGEKQISVYTQTKYNDKYISLTDPNTLSVLKSLGAEVTLYEKEKKAVIETSLGVREINGKTLKAWKREQTLSPPPFFTKGKYFVHIKHLPLIVDCAITKGKDSKLFFDGIFRTVTTTRNVKNKKQLLVAIECSCPFTAEPLMLKNPDRYAVDLRHISLSKEQTALKKREIKDNNVGTITYGQNQNYPGTVRVVIPITANTDAQILKPSKKREYLIGMTTKLSDPIGFSFTAQKVTGVKGKGNNSKYEINIDVSGSVTYETHRYSNPDNRVVIDIHKSQLAGKKFTLKPNTSLISEIKVAQNQLKPSPITRVVIELKKNYECKITSSKNKITAAVTSKTVSMQNSQMDTTGATSYPTGKKVICIDPGHGGYDPGAINNTYGLKEKNLTLQIAKKTSEILTKRGWNVVMTRTTDRDVSYYGSSDTEELHSRVTFAENMKADIFVSIHCNASASSHIKGVSTHWYKKSDKLLGTYIHQELVKKLPTTNRKLSSNNFYILRKTSMPAILIESGFITNSSDLKYLNSSYGQTKIATAIADGIEKYFKK